MPVINPIFSTNIFYTKQIFINPLFSMFTKRSTTIASIAINSIKKMVCKSTDFKLSERKAPINVIEIKNKKAHLWLKVAIFINKIHYNLPMIIIQVYLIFIRKIKESLDFFTNNSNFRLQFNIKFSLITSWICAINST